MIARRNFIASVAGIVPAASTIALAPAVLVAVSGLPLKPDDEVPNQLVRFVADQLHLDPASADAYAARDTTRRQHLSILQREYGFRAYHRDTEQQLAAWPHGSCRLPCERKVPGFL